MMPVDNKDLLHPLFTWRSIVASERGPKSPVTRHVLLTISLHMNEKGGSCFPSIDLLQKETGLSRPSIVNHIKIAVDEGWLDKKILGKNGQGWSRHEYRSIIPDNQGSKGDLPPLKQCSFENGDSLVNQGGKGDLPRHSTGGKPHSKKAVKEVYSSTSKSTSYTAAKKNSCIISEKKIISDHAWFSGWWCFVYQAIVGSKYPYKKKDAGQVKQLLKQLDGLTDLVSRSCAYLLLPEGKRYPKEITIGGLSFQIAQIVDVGGDTIDRFIDNQYLPIPGTTNLKDFQPWKECNVSKSAT